MFLIRVKNLFKNKIILFLLISFAGLVVSVSAGLLWLDQQLNKPLSLPESPYVFTVGRGETLASLSRELEAKGVLSSALALRIFARYTGRQTVRRGEFELRNGVNSVELLSKLGSNDTIQHHLTLLEGWTFKQALVYLHSKTKLKHELKDLPWAEQKKVLGIDVKHPEGYFFPDTYRYQSGESDVDLLRRAHKKLTRVLAEQWSKKAEGLPYKSAYDALIMASIIEKETAKDSERETIAGVFIRRIRLGMRLQTDPTVIYGMGDKYQGNIRRKDLKTPTPYNTYVIKGLPPTPIALVGERSIYAALHPNDSGNIFFVAKGDGSHFFSKTLTEHNKAVREYQINKRKKNYRSSPK